jgi:predicted secreted hydrolase
MDRFSTRPAKFLLLLLCATIPGSRGGSTEAAGGSDSVRWRGAAPGYAWSFPADHRSHAGYRTEWWYFTGHLQSQDGARRFGYQLTFFRFGLFLAPPDLDSAWSASDLVMGHAAVTDLTGGEHHFSEVLYRAVPLLGGFPDAPDPRLAWSAPPAGSERPWTLRWQDGAFELVMEDRARGMAMELVARPRRGPVLQGPGGFSRKGQEPDSASLYYSFTRLETRGSITVQGDELPVGGVSWSDREFGSDQLDEDQAGWDWFGLQLDDGRDLMIYRLRRDDGETDFRWATLVETDGDVRYLAEGEWTVRSVATWRSDDTGTVYPARWTLEVPGEGLQLEIVPELANQENRGRLTGWLHYWEGAVVVQDRDGGRVGSGYVELTGYGTRGRPPL